MFEFTVDRRNWLRGEGVNSSYLYRSTDGKMCCMGFCALAQGCTIDDIFNVRDLKCIDVDKLPLLNETHIDEILPESIYKINDHVYINDFEREKRLTEMLAHLNVKVTFIN